MSHHGERNEGWGSVDNAPAAHYFREGRSLCGRWLAFSPHWESRQDRGQEPARGSGTCKGCWKKAPEVAPA